MTTSNSTNPLDLAYEAGAILLENGAEISRVEGTMRRIAGHFGVEDESFFVLSNGIIAAGEGYARSKFIPIRGASLDKVVAVNQLSREVAAGQCTLEDFSLGRGQCRFLHPLWRRLRRLSSLIYRRPLALGLCTIHRFQTPLTYRKHRHWWVVVVHNLL